MAVVVVYLVREKRIGANQANTVRAGWAAEHHVVPPITKYPTTVNNLMTGAIRLDNKFSEI